MTKQIINEFHKIKVPYQENVSLKSYSSFKIGGIASIIITPKTIEQLQECIALCRNFNEKPLIIGNGSNLLFCGDTYEGVIIHIGHNLSRIEKTSVSEIYCEAGALLSSVCLFALDCELTGLEFAYGIPGAVGGAVYMNAGAFGGEIQDVIKSVTYIDYEGNIKNASTKALQFAYRDSIFQHSFSCIVGAYFNLKQGNEKEIQDKMTEIINKRNAKQPLNVPSAGSTFKRPNGAFAAALIEESGLKGYCIGDAAVSEKHAGFVVNRGDATCEEVLALIKHVKETVYEKTGHQLEEEVKVITTHSL